MVISNPLDLPEIRETVAPYLSSDDLTRCIRVCKTWHSSFHPFLWISVDIPTEQDKGPSPEDLRKHRALIQRLVYHGHSSDDLHSIHYPSLRTLHVRFNNSKEFRINTIIKNHPSLTHLELRRPSMTSDVFKWIFPNTLSNLSTLRLKGVVLFLLPLDAFWEVCSRLDTLDLQVLGFLCFSAPPETPWRVKDLSLITVQPTDPSTQLKLIRQCPELRRLEWDVWPEPFSIDDFIQSMSTDTWPMLEDLGVDNSEASDQELSLIIGKMHRVIGLSVVYCTFKMQSMAALRHHFPWLRRLNISCPANYTDISEFVIEVLKSCPQLESLKADDLRAESLMNDTPWACQRSLRILELRFGIIPAQFGNDSQCEAIIGRLIGLVNLERLDVPASWLNDFQSRCRLEQLSRLTRLRKLIRHGVEAINE